MKRGIIFSLFLHSLLFLSLITGHKGKGEGQEEKPPEGQKKGLKDGLDKDRFIPKETVQIELVDVPSKSGLKKARKKKKHKKEDCSFYYGGIGVTMGAHDEVAEVAPGYPADREGIKVGDFIVSNDIIRGQEGTSVTITITNVDNIKRTVSLIREKVCYAKVGTNSGSNPAPKRGWQGP